MTVHRPASGAALRARGLGLRDGGLRGSAVLVIRAEQRPGTDEAAGNGEIDLVDLTPPADAAKPRRRLAEVHLPPVFPRPGVVGVHLLRSVPDGATRSGPTPDVVSGLDAADGRWLLLVEGSWPDHREHKARLRADIDALRARGAEVGASGSYRLLSHVAA